MTRRVCWHCIGEPVVRAEIRQEQPARTCSFCGFRRRAISLEDLATRVKHSFEMVVGQAPAGYVVRDGNPDWAPDGEYPSCLLTEMLQGFDEAIGSELVAILAERSRHYVNDGGFDWYDDTSDSYTILDAEDDWFGRSWKGFCDEIKHHRRFFLDQSAQVLNEIFGPVLRGEWPPGGAVRTIGPGTEHSHIFRGRAANDRNTQISIYQERLRQLGAPAPGIAGAGRMNAAGISVFYGSFDRDTCVAELRTPVGGHAIVGRFEILRPLTVLDLTLLDREPEPLSYFDPHYSQQMAYTAFMQGFHAEIRRAIIPGRETLDYLPTQVIAEYLWSQTEPAIDGIIFGSAQITESANNVVLFPDSASVEGAEEEVARTIRHFHFREARADEDADEADRQDRDVVAFRPLRAEDQEAAVERPFDEDSWFGALFDPLDPIEQPGPALRLGDDDVWRIRVDSIRYDTHSIPAGFRNMQDEDID
ncbi:RES domain-containing protein [Sphingobium sp. 3R8]|uniref:RES domain-containing protein n=1 Tax=Sphingobium sp. 3R8 TaxID=2874921 RepID=UPI001CCA56EF|nr:RES domain-containing protein [Sphingobium sp. 3R8]MBZ9648155.1 RES domain-containing protein [Sphingobium sp. 3R8]